MILSQATNRHGNTYRCFFCTGRYSHTYELPYIPLGRVEEAVERHYATVRFTSAFIIALRADLTALLEEQQSAAKLLHAQLTKQLRELDTKETNLIDLAADGTLPQDKIRARLHEITRQRKRLTERPGDTDQDLSRAGEIIEACLRLLEDPQGLYRRCDDQPADCPKPPPKPCSGTGCPGHRPGAQTPQHPSQAGKGRCGESNRGRPGGRPLGVAWFQLSYSGGPVGI
ncbi:MULTISPECIES: hypothetical protein [unclassified Streptomyces]|uniref:hypothetical protein n=1 Tax=unclassified Streptomyces TaxID=2593676 RepID=UPI0037F3B67D